MKTILLATFNEAEPAEALKNRLEQEAIRVLHRDESNLQRFGFMTSPAAPHKLYAQVDDFTHLGDYEKACQLIDQWDKTDHVLDQAIRCPQCHSARVEYPQFTRRFVTPMVVELFVSLGLFPKQYYCENCQYTWTKDVKPEPERDILGWPRT